MPKKKKVISNFNFIFGQWLIKLILLIREQERKSKINLEPQTKINMIFQINKLKEIINIKELEETDKINEAIPTASHQDLDKNQKIRIAKTQKLDKLKELFTRRDIIVRIKNEFLKNKFKLMKVEIEEKEEKVINENIKIIIEDNKHIKTLKKKISSGI